MKIKLLINKSSEEILTLPDTESVFYKELGMRLTQIAAPATVIVYTDSGTEARYSLTKRSGTLLIQEGNNNISFPDSDHYPTVYLTCINEEHNNYKFYKLEEKNEECIATYGRIGTGRGELYGERSYKYPLRMFWIKYYEKLQKGYIDQSDVYIVDEPENSSSDIKDAPQEEETVSYKLYQKLMKLTRRTVETVCVSQHITEEMVKRTKSLLLQLYEASTLDEFNQILKQITTVNPRKVLCVQNLLAKSTEQFKEIVDREESLLSAMEAVAGHTSAKTRINDGFAKNDILIKIATDKQKDKVLSKLDPSLRRKVLNVYRVDSKRHKERFEKYCDQNHISEIKGLWHGSRNENWVSIIKQGLLLNPNAIITGKMFGNGIYFAPGSTKSWNYTSGNGAYWTGGTSPVAFMGLYATAYGNPLYVACAHSYSKRSLSGKNCVHAKAGLQLRNDEIIFYDESAMVLQYLVEFAA